MSACRIGGPESRKVAILFSDITDRKQAAIALETTLQRFYVILSSMYSSVLLVTNEGHAEFANQAFCDRFGLEDSPTDLVGLDARDVIEKIKNAYAHPDEAIARIREVLDRGQPVRGEELAIQGGQTYLRDFVPVNVQGNPYGRLWLHFDITDRKRAEEALRQSERRVRLKLDSILSPEGDIGNLDLADIIDAPAIQSLMDHFHELAHIPMAIIDLQGKVLVGAGWQDVCTKFHRVHPETCKHCIESDTQLSAGVASGEFKLYRCKNNMWDVATPIMVGGRQVGNLFTGQFFFDDEPLDYDLFRSQARRYGLMSSRISPHWTLFHA